MTGISVEPERLEKVNENEMLIAEKRGVLVHGSSVSYNDNAYLFSGKAGAGKSTLAKKLSCHANIIHEDSTIIFTDGKRWYCRASVENSLERNNKKRYIADYSLCSIVRRFIILEKEFSSDSSIHKIDNPEIIWNHLIRNTAPPITDKKLMKNYYYVVEKIISELHFFSLSHNLVSDAHDILRMITSEI